MPELVIHTSVSRNKITPTVLTELSKTLAGTIGKPEQVSLFILSHFCVYRLILIYIYIYI